MILSNLPGHMTQSSSPVSTAIISVSLILIVLLLKNYKQMMKTFDFYMTRKKLFRNVGDSLGKEKFLSSVIFNITNFRNQGFGTERTKTLVNIIFCKHGWKIFTEVSLYDKIEKPYLLVSLIEIVSLAKNEKLFFIKDELKRRLAFLIAKANMDFSFDGKLSRTFDNQEILIQYLGKDEHLLIHKFEFSKAV